MHPNGAFAVPLNKYIIRDSVTNGLWIWESRLPYDYAQIITLYVSKSFYIPGTPTSAQMIIRADDYCFVKLNNVDTSCANSNGQYTNCDLTSKIVTGNNIMNITVGKNLIDAL